VASVTGFNLSLDQSFMKMWMEKAKESKIYLQMIQAINLQVDGHDANLSIDFKDPSQAIFASGMVSTAFEFLKGMIVQAKKKPGEIDNLLDWIAYSQQQVYAAQAMTYANKIIVKSSGSILNINYRMKETIADVYKNLEGSFVLGIGSLVMLYKSKNLNLNQLKSINLGMIPSMGTGGSGGTCSKEIKMIDQSIEFYNSDHIKTGPWEKIKSQIFEEGYLPEDLVCKGILIKDNSIFYTNSNGNVTLK
ncbi:hypothetical protein MJH12_20370, partial [bacterium]|nr:hypothetical protein [bacterium]